MRLAVVDQYDRELVPGAIPTPALAQAGQGQAYFVASKSGLPGVWYLRAPGYESPDGQYSRVRVVEVPE